MILLVSKDPEPTWVNEGPWCQQCGKTLTHKEVHTNDARQTYGELISYYCDKCWQWWLNNEPNAHE